MIYDYGSEGGREGGRDNTTPHQKILDPPLVEIVHMF